MTSPGAQATSIQSNSEKCTIHQSEAWAQWALERMGRSAGQRHARRKHKRKTLTIAAVGRREFDRAGIMVLHASALPVRQRESMRSTSMESCKCVCGHSVRSMPRSFCVPAVKPPSKMCANSATFYAMESRVGGHRAHRRTERSRPKM